jgi:O-antigen ligase
LYLRHLQISLIRILEVAIPLGLIVVLTVLILHPVTYWGTRFATYFVDPNTLGSQTFILAIITLLSLRFSSGKGVYLVALKIIGSIAGIYVAIHAGSRGGWISAPFILFMLILVLLSEANHLQGEQRRKKIGQIMLFLALAFIATLALFASSDFLLTRVSDGYNEIRNWLTGESIDSSAGIRLSMWKISLQLSQNSFLFGYGEKDIASVIKGSAVDIPINSVAIHDLVQSGPHSDILSKLLSIGVVGLFAYFALLAVPFFICFAKRCAGSVDVRQASQTAIYYITGVLICGLSNEQLSLKYLCSFYGLMIAVFLAEAMRVKPSKTAVL